MSATHMADGQPGTTLLDRLARTLTELPAPQAYAVNACAILLVVVTDAATPFAYVFGPFYFLVICLGAWTLGGRAAYAIAGLCAALAVAFQSPDARFGLALFWNIGTRLVCNLAITAMISALRRTYDHERYLGRTDGLTGALNRRAFQDAISSMLRRARRKGDVLIISYVDLDGFKAVNDSHGHAAGDDVLAAFAHAARNELRANDALARVGGDEFVIIQVCDEEDDHYGAAAHRHERLTAALKATGYDVTCSMGVVIAEGGVADEAQLVAFADELLYEVKRAGKNSMRIAVVSPETERLAA
jgi:diguanylate cyclase (GGDEF)-like protein